MKRIIMVVWQKGTKITYKQFRTDLDFEQGDKLGYGRTLFITNTIPFLKRILIALNDIKVGIQFHYPICCVLNFCIDVVLNRPSTALRWSDRTEYVECVFCHRRNGGKQRIPETWF